MCATDAPIACPTCTVGPWVDAPTSQGAERRWPGRLQRVGARAAGGGRLSGVGRPPVIGSRHLVVRTFLPAALLGGALVLGLLTEPLGEGRSGAPSWVADVVVGWTFLVTGWLAWSRASRATGVLLGLVGATWFLGNLSPYL